MADIFTEHKRREIMRAVKSKNSKAETLVFHYLQTNKIYFQRHYKRAVGSPDVALPRKKKATAQRTDLWRLDNPQSMGKRFDSEANS